MTCATDSENIKVVFNSCKDTVLRSNFRWVPISESRKAEINYRTDERRIDLIGIIG